MPELKIGYARVSSDARDLTAQRGALQALGVPVERMYLDYGLTGRSPGLSRAARPWRRAAAATRWS